MLTAAHSEPTYPRRLSTADHAAIQLQLAQWRELNQKQPQHLPDADTHSHPTTPDGEKSDPSSAGVGIVPESDPLPSESDFSAMTPFLLDPNTFAQQDIFDRQTFEHLAAESAAKYAAACHAKGLTHSHSLSVDQLPSIKALAHAEEKQNGNGAHLHRSRSMSTTEDAEFLHLMREMHAEEVSRVIASDLSLQRMQRQIQSYKRERQWLQQSYDAKLAALAVEHDQLQRRNEKLRKLTRKVTAAERSQLNTPSNASSCASSPSHSLYFRTTRSNSISSIGAFGSTFSSLDVSPTSPTRSSLA